MKLTDFVNSLINLDLGELIFLCSSLLILLLQVWLFLKQRSLSDSDVIKQMGQAIGKIEVEFERFEYLIGKAIEKVDHFSKDKDEQSLALEKRVRNDIENLGRQNLEIIEALKDVKDEVVHQQVTRHKLNDILVAKVDKKIGI